MTTATWTDEQLSAFLDGELPASDMEVLSRDIEADRDLAARLERLGGANAAYRAAIGAIDKQPMSAGLAAAMAAPAPAKVIPLRSRSIGAFVMEHRAMAAALVCAAAVWSVSSAIRPSGQALPDLQGQIAASSPLYRVLEETPSSVPVTLPGGAKATPRLTFTTASGDYCRQYQLMSEAGGSEAIACRRNSSWHVEVAVFGVVGGAGDYQTASAPASQTLEAFVDGAIAGSPLNADEEAAAIKSGWSGGRP